MNKEELLPWLDKTDVNEIIFVQGASRLSWKQRTIGCAFCLTYEFESIMRMVFVCSDVSFTSKDSLWVSHSNVGGEKEV